MILNFGSSSVRLHHISKSLRGFSWLFLAGFAKYNQENENFNIH